MGADFCFAILPIVKMSPERIAEALAILAPDLEYDQCDTPEEMEESLEKITGFFDTYCEGSEGGYDNRRSVGHLNLQGVTYYITGGMSWGDPPTDEYDEFNYLDRQIGHLLNKWVLEDNLR